MGGVGRSAGWRGVGGIALGLLVAGCGSGNGTRVPDGAGKPPAQLGKGENYRKAYPGFGIGTAIAASNVDQGSGNAKLEYLATGKDPVTLAEHGEPDSVRVSPKEPAAALFLTDAQRNGVGTLNYVDLAKTVVRPVQDGTGVPAEGFFFGQTGTQLLFVGEFLEGSGRGRLKWSDGTTTKVLANNVSPAAVLFSLDRRLAVVGVEMDERGAGQLLTVELKTGEATPLVDKAQVLVGDQPEFALSGGGDFVAYVAPDGSVQKVAVLGGQPTPVANRGVHPGISDDGQLVGYTLPDGDGAGTYVWVNGGSNTSIDTRLAETRPVFSKDNAWMVFFTEVKHVGAGRVGTAFIAPTSAAVPAISIGAQVGLDQVLFDRHSPVTRVAAVTALATQSGQPDYDGYGRIAVGKPGEKLTDVVPGARAGGLLQLDVSNALAYLGNVVPGTGMGTAFVQETGKAPLKLSEKAVPGTLQVSAGLSTPFDRLLFLAEPQDSLVDGVAPAKLYGGKIDAAPLLLESGVIDAKFTREGRALLVVPSGEKAGVWTLPVAP